MAAETTALNTWLYGVLRGDAALATALGTLATAVYAPDAPPAAPPWATAWYPGAAPPDAPRVYGVWSWAPTPDARGMGGLRIAVQPRLRVVVVAATADPDALIAAASRLDALLHGATGTTAAVAVDSCQRLYEVSTSEDYQGVRWVSLGGLYEVRARSLE